jgi:PAS domain S-box-containing protein
MADNLQSQPQDRRVLIDDLSNAYACYKVVRDKSGQPIDAVIIDANKESEIILGKKREEAVGRKVTEFLQEEEVSKWIDIYTSLQSTGRKASHKFYSKIAGRWFQADIFMDEEDNVNTVCYDISDLYLANMKLSLAERNYRAIVENSPNIIMKLDRNFRNIFVNSAVKESTGINPEDFIGRTHREMGFPAEMCDYWEHMIEKVFESRESLKDTFEFRGITFDWYLIPEFNAIHEAESVLSITHDVTASDTKIHTLMESEERYRLLLESIQDMVTIINYDYIITGINEAVVKMTLKPRLQLLGRRYSEVFPGVEGTPLLAACRRVMKMRIPDVVTIEFTDSRGHTVYYENHIAPVPEGIMVIGSDITERKTGEELLRQSEEKYRNLVEQSIDGITVIDENGVVVEFNKGMENITGLIREQVIGHPAASLFFSLIPEEARKHISYDDIVQQMQHYRSTEYDDIKGKIYTRTILRQDCTRRNVQYMFYTFKTIGKLYACCMIRDITEQKRLEELKKIAEENAIRLNEALELDKLRTEFFANLSHELRTPLNIIFSSVQLMDKCIEDNLKLYGTDAVMLRNITSARQNCYRLMKLINNLIDATKIDAGFYQLNPVDCDIIKVVEDITLSIVEYTRSKGIELIFDTDVEEKITVCDPDKIERIMLNLLSNAVKFSSSGSTINVRISDGEEYITISVEDKGIGIPEDKLGHLFERFTQVDKSLTRPHEGSGIGLSLTKSLAEMHGGSISVKSQYGKGSTFEVRLPIRKLNPADSGALCTPPQDNRIQRINVEFFDIHR